MIPNTPERILGSVLGSVAVTAQAFQRESSAYGRVPGSLFLFPPLYTAQRLNERFTILHGIREFSAGVKLHAQLSHQLLFCALLREGRMK